jgi:hypothetical protein
MATPGESSGTYLFAPSNGQIVLESLERLQIHDTSIVRDKLPSIRMSLNLELERWSSLGINLWKIITGTFDLVEGQSVYVFPSNLVVLTEMWYTTVNGNGTGQNSDRIMTPLTRTQYAMIANKQTLGIPTQYWYERLQTPQVTIWQPPFQGAPNYVLNWFGLQRIQDASIASGETPDLVYRAYDALCACLAYRLYPKFIPRSEWPAMEQILKAKRDEAWNEFATNDNELGPMRITPNLGGYGNMR